MYIHGYWVVYVCAGVTAERTSPLGRRAPVAVASSAAWGPNLASGGVAVIPDALPLGPVPLCRYEELTRWAAGMAKHFPEIKILTDTRGRNRLYKEVDPV